MLAGDEPIVVDQFFNASMDRVWRAITEVDQMQIWFFHEIASFVPEVGFETRFNIKTPEREFLHVWEITEVIEPEKIAYGWRYEGYTGDSHVAFELTSQNNGTLLRLTHTVTQSFPTNIPEFNRESGVEGWKYFIQQSLLDYLSI